MVVGVEETMTRHDHNGSTRTSGSSRARAEPGRGLGILLLCALFVPVCNACVRSG